MEVDNFQGTVEPERVVTSNKEWWEYWRRYWDAKDSESPLAHDYACDVTIPAGP
jgi:hypothetical protein